jgi:hypothetical protein
MIPRASRSIGLTETATENEFANQAKNQESENQ